MKVLLLPRICLENSSFSSLDDLVQIGKIFTEKNEILFEKLIFFSDKSNSSLGSNLLLLHLFLCYYFENLNHDISDDKN